MFAGLSLAAFGTPTAPGFQPCTVPAGTALLFTGTDRPGVGYGMIARGGRRRSPPVTASHHEHRPARRTGCRRDRDTSSRAPTIHPGADFTLAVITAVISSAAPIGRPRVVGDTQRLHAQRPSLHRRIITGTPTSASAPASDSGRAPHDTGRQTAISRATQPVAADCRSGHVSYTFQGCSTDH